MTDSDGNFLTTINSLGAHYAKPTERILKKQRDHVSALGRTFIAASPFLVLATGSQEGLDCSPKGDRPGFVEVSEDGRTLLIPDRVSTIASDRPATKPRFAFAAEAEQFLAGSRRRHCDAIGRSSRRRDASR
jgi:predicted pyridoxine 5'-phosphate oxidase superfamily flavin-nucleotide-binding protein